VSHKKLLINVVSIAIAFIVLVLLWSSTQAAPKQYQWTLVSLQRLRSGIQIFKDENGRYPATLSELNTLSSNSGGEKSEYGENMEFISSMDGCNIEYDNLNGAGGWYYNCKTGEVRVNLTKPLKEYFKDCYDITIRYKIPSDW
jgi:hypothetical protein